MRGKTVTQVLVVYQGQPSNAVSIAVSAVMPGIFTADSSGHGEGSIVYQDGTVNSAGNPAAVGSVVAVYATGEGQTNPAGAPMGDGENRLRGPERTARNETRAIVVQAVLPPEA